MIKRCRLHSCTHFPAQLSVCDSRASCNQNIIVLYCMVLYLCASILTWLRCFINHLLTYLLTYCIINLNDVNTNTRQINDYARIYTKKISIIHTNVITARLCCRKMSVCPSVCLSHDVKHFSLSGSHTILVFTARCVCIARTMPWQDVCLFVRPSVTRQYCVQTVTHILKVF